MNLVYRAFRKKGLTYRRVAEHIGVAPHTVFRLAKYGEGSDDLRVRVLEACEELSRVPRRPKPPYARESYAPHIHGVVEFVDQERLRAGLTVAALCKGAGVSEAAYSRWVSGKSSPSVYTLSYLLEVLGFALVAQKL